MAKEWSRNRWNAYRKPTDDEVRHGHPAEEMVWIGAEVDQEPAANLLREHGGGQIQFDRDGELLAVNEFGVYPGKS